MSQRESNMLWLRDVLDQLAGCQRQLEWTEDPETTNLLLETMLRDLECCRRLCEQLWRRVPAKQAVLR